MKVMMMMIVMMITAHLVIHPAPHLAVPVLPDCAHQVGAGGVILASVNHCKNISPC